MYLLESIDGVKVYSDGNGYFARLECGARSWFMQGDDSAEFWRGYDDACEAGREFVSAYLADYCDALDDSPRPRAWGGK